jgi:hypothetical protein
MSVAQGNPSSASHGGPTRTHLKIAVLAAAIDFALATMPALATDFVVIDAGDSGPGTLRQAALDANATSGPHTIAFALPAGTTIALTSGEILFQDRDVAIEGPGRDALTISGSRLSRIFDVQGDGTLSVSELTLRDGLALGDDSNVFDQRGGAILVGIPNTDFTLPPPPEVPGLALSRVDIFGSAAYSPTDGGGGGVFMQDGTLAIDHCTIDGNFARRNGGAVTTRRGTVNISDTAFTNNIADIATADGEVLAEGGGVFINRSAGLMTRSIVRGNALTDMNGIGAANGGGLGGAGLDVLMQFEPFRIDDSEFSDNVATDLPFAIGGGLRCHEEPDGTLPTLTLVNSTISGNVGNYGVGAEVGCTTHILNTTVADNTSTNYYGDGGHPGLEAYSPNYGEQVQATITSSIISGNLGGGADVGIYHYDGYDDPAFVGSNALVLSVDDNVTLPPDTMIGVDPGLAPLANNGGATRTHALSAGSVAIDAGINPEMLPYDQRGAGFAREIGGAADIGALESDPDLILANGFD